MSSKQPNNSGQTPTSKGSDSPRIDRLSGENHRTSTSQKSPSSTRATDGSISTLGQTMALSPHPMEGHRRGTAGNSGEPKGESSALKQWLEQGPREDPWNPVGWRKE